MLTRLKFVGRRLLKKIIMRLIYDDVFFQDLAGRVRNQPYELLAELKQQQLQLPKVASKEATLARMIKDRVSIARFGDGEFKLMLGEGIPFQTASADLSARLREIIATDSPKVLIGLPDTFGSLAGHDPGFSAPFWRDFWPRYRERVYDALDMEKHYFSTYFTRPYISFTDKCDSAAYFAQCRQIWQGRDVVIVEGDKTRFGMGNDLLAGAKSIARVICPALNAYDHYARILAACVQEQRGVLFLIALGPTATVLAYDLALQGYQAIDIGHLDIEYEWFLMGATTRVKVPRKYVLEAGGTQVTSPADAAYASQVKTRLI